MLLLIFSLFFIDPLVLFFLSTKFPRGHASTESVAGGRYKVSPLCELSCVSSSVLTGRKTLYFCSRSKESHHCVSSCVSSGPKTQRKSGDTGGRNKVSPRSEFSCESSSCLTESRTLDTRSRSIKCCQCAFFGASLGSRTWRKFCHIQCRERAFLQYGSVDVTLNLKS